MDKMMEKTAAYIDAHRQEMLDLWEELVMIESGRWKRPGSRPGWRRWKRLGTP